MSSPSDSRQDRRRSPREDALSRVEVVVQASSLLALMRDINATGFSAEVSEAVVVGKSYRFEMHFPRLAIVLNATCLHCKPSTAWAEPAFLAGFAFNGLEGPPRTVVMDFIDQLAALPVAKT
jgi:hypothetical protein